jgi:hypothetical protein
MSVCSRRVNKSSKTGDRLEAVTPTTTAISILGSGASKCRRLSLPQYCSWPLVFYVKIHRFLELFKIVQRPKLNSYWIRKYTVLLLGAA